MFIFHLFQFCKRINRMFNMSLNQLNNSCNLLHVFILFIISSNMPPKCNAQFPVQKFLHILWNEPLQWQCHQFIIYTFLKINLLIHVIFIGCRWRWWGHCPSPAGRRKHLTKTLPSSCQKTSNVFFLYLN